MSNKEQFTLPIVAILIIVTGYALLDYRLDESPVYQTGWTRIIGESGNDEAFFVTETSDQGILLVGQTSYENGFLTTDARVIKLDKNGKTIWTYEPSEEGYETIKSIVEVCDGYIFAGTKGVGKPGNSGMNSIFMGKLDFNGSIIWLRKQPQTGLHETRGESIIQCKDGGFLVAGTVYTYSDFRDQVYILKTDANGNAQWNASFGGLNDEKGYHVEQTSDGGLIIVGRSIAGHSYDVLVVKTDRDGNLEWSNTYGEDKLDIGYCIRETPDGGFVVAGRARREDKYGDALVFKIGNKGEVIWETLFGYDHSERADCIVTWREGYIIVGETRVHGSGNGDVYVVGLSADGEVLWERFFGGLKTDRGNWVAKSKDGGIIIAGQIFSGNVADEGDFYVIKMHIGK